MTALCAARDGSLWIGFKATGIVSRLYNGRVVTYTFADGVPLGRIGAILEDHEGTIWAGAGGLSRFRNGQWERVEVRPGVAFGPVRGLYEDRDDNLWVGTSAHVFLRRAGHDAFEQMASPSRVQAISQDAAGRIWVTDSRRAFRPLDDRKSSHPSSLESRRENGYDLLHDQEGNLWVATLGDGLLHVIGDGSSEPTRIEHYTRADGLAHDVVWSILEDREGNIWAGTQGGLTRLSRARITSIAGFGGRKGVIRSIAAGHDGSFWAGTANGLVRFFQGRQTWYDQQAGLPGSDIAALHVDRAGRLWVATDRGLARSNGPGRFSPLALTASVGPSWAFAMTTDHQGSLWVTNSEGLSRWDEGKGKLSLVREPGLDGRPATAVYADKAGRVWVGFADGGVAVLRGRDVRLHSEKDGLADGRVTAIFEDQAGDVWVGTTAGLSRLADDRITTLPVKNNLAGHSVAGITRDDGGYLWLALSGGIARLHPTEFVKAVGSPSHRMRYDLYDTTDGLAGVPLSSHYPTAARADDGTLWFITADGLSIVDPRNLPRPRLPPPVRIDGIVADEHSLAPAAGLRLPALTSRLEISYTAASLTASETIRFRYMLEGFDRDWISAGAGRRASYTNLPPGQYRFRVTASNKDGIWNESAAVWQFSILPAFYQQGWFYAVVVIAAALVVWGAWQVRLRATQRRFALILAERARLAREIHDTLLQSLVGLALQVDTTSDQLDASAAPVKQRLERIRRQIERYVREARQSIWDLRSPTLEARDLATALREAGESFTAASDARFEFVLSGDPRRCAPKVEEQLLRIGQEAVSNAVRHAHATLIRMELRYNGDSVVLRVSDDGRGFDVQKTTRAISGHLGLMSMQERAKEINAHLRLASNPGAGTELEIGAPLSSAA